MKSLILGAALLALAGPALAAGDAEAGKKAFGKCKACHAIMDGDTAIVKGGKVGPNLYGVVGRVVGSVDGYAYSDGLKKIGESGTAWDEASIAEYAQDPSAWIDKTAGDDTLKGKMTFKAKADDAENVAAYLASVAK